VIIIAHCRNPLLVSLDAVLTVVILGFFKSNFGEILSAMEAFNANMLFSFKIFWGQC